MKANNRLMGYFIEWMIRFRIYWNTNKTGINKSVNSEKNFTESDDVDDEIILNEEKMEKDNFSSIKALKGKN